MATVCVQCGQDIDSDNAICEECSVNPVCFALEQLALVQSLNELIGERERVRAALDALENSEPSQAEQASHVFLEAEKACHEATKNSLAKAKSRASWLYVMGLNGRADSDSKKLLADLEYERAVKGLGPWADDPGELLSALGVEALPKNSAPETMDGKCPVCLAPVLASAGDFAEGPCPNCVEKFVKQSPREMKVLVQERKKAPAVAIKIKKQDARKEDRARLRKERKDAPRKKSKPSFVKWISIFLLFSTAPAALYLLKDMDQSPKSRRLSIMGVAIVCQCLALYLLHKKTKRKAPKDPDPSTTQMSVSESPPNQNETNNLD
ncbi:MAG: hypothetical protein P1V97_11270 [Planctomycetota bacterium]|nr:hypothetical protein [Planctomycetota bacterium]